MIDIITLKMHIFQEFNISNQKRARKLTLFIQNLKSIGANTVVECFQHWKD